MAAMQCKDTPARLRAALEQVNSLEDLEAVVDRLLITPADGPERDTVAAQFKKLATEYGMDPYCAEAYIRDMPHVDMHNAWHAGLDGGIIPPGGG